MLSILLTGSRGFTVTITHMHNKYLSTKTSTRHASQWHRMSLCDKPYDKQQRLYIQLMLHVVLVVPCTHPWCQYVQEGCPCVQGEGNRMVAHCLMCSVTRMTSVDSAIRKTHPHKQLQASKPTHISSRHKIYTVLT